MITKKCVEREKLVVIRSMNSTKNWHRRTDVEDFFSLRFLPRRKIGFRSRSVTGLNLK